MVKVQLFALIGALAIVSAACTPTAVEPVAPIETAAPSTSTSPTSSSVVSAPDAAADSSEFDAFVGRLAGDLLRLEPQTITELGATYILGRFDSDLDDLSPATRNARVAVATSALASIDRLAVDDLTDDQVVTLRIIRWHLEDLVAMARFSDHAYATNYITGYHASFPEFMADVHPIESLPDAEAYIERLEASAEQMAQIQNQVERSASLGITPTTTGRDIAAWQIGNVTTSQTNHPLVTDLVTRLTALGTINQPDIDELEQRAEQAVRTSVLPGYRSLLTAVNAIEARSDAAPGVWALPNGDAYYAAVLRHHLSINMTPAEVHQLGLTEVERLTGEIASVLTDLGYDVETAGFAGAASEARADSGAFPLATDADRQDMLDRAQTAVTTATDGLSELFTVFPSTPIEVVRPRPGREGGSGAYYSPPPMDGSRPGRYYLSLGGAVMPAQTFATTNYHEAVPGHHFQLSIQRESADLSVFQRAVTFTGFTEGWALYAERLAFEAGLYDTDPSSNLGRLRMELLRAARMVTDTGIHSLRWSRQEAIDYLASLGFPEGSAASEVDRYIIWPGQAPSYLVGMLEILRLRDAAQMALGAEFDIARFHDEILRHGSVPLSVLEHVVDTWVASELASG